MFALVEGPSLGWGSPAVLVSAPAGVLALVAFALIESRSHDPLFPPRLVANRNLATAVGIAFLFWATFGSVLYFLTLYFQDVHGYDALQTGVAFLCRPSWWSPPPRSPGNWSRAAGSSSPSWARSSSGRWARSPWG